MHLPLLVAAAVHHHHHTSGWLLGLAGLAGGFAVGITGMGGGALMTPALVLLFRVDPTVAVASDLVNSLIMKPIGGAVHVRKGTIHWPLVRWLVLGSVPAAFLGAFALHSLGNGKHVQNEVKVLLGWALIVASAAIIAKATLTAREQRRLADLGQQPNERPYRIKPVATLLVGIVGGLIVGMTSVGSGSLMIVLLMLLYPRLSSKSLVGTDLVQAIPLVGAAALGQLLFGHIDFGLAGALIVGSVPGVYLGARCSAAAPDGIVRPVLVFVLASSALALLVGKDYHALAWAIAIVALVGLPLWGAVDATLLPSAQWAELGRSRTRWVAAQGIAAPFGVGFAISLVYFAWVRTPVKRAQVGPEAAADSREPAPALAPA